MLEFKSNKPMINSAYAIYGAGMYAAKPHDMTKLMSWVKRTPECIGIIKRIATDIVTEIDFVSIAKQQTGRPSDKLKLGTEDKAVQFSKVQFLKQKLTEVIYDWLITGDAYLWMGKISNEDITKVAKKYSSSFNFTEKEIKQNYLDEDYSGVTSLKVVPSTTMYIDHTENEIKKYKQQVAGSSKEFNVDEIIHAKFMNLDGKVYGYTPMISAYGTIQTLNYISDSAGYYFENGGRPDMVFKLPKEMPNSPNVKALTSTLEKYKKMEHKHGNLIFTGELEIEDLIKTPKDMEYRQLAIYQTGKLAFAFNMPADTFSAILGTEVRGTAMGSDMEDAGYNRNIEQAQDYWETLLNSQLWNPFFKVDMRLTRKFRQDKIRLIQEMAMSLGVIEHLFKHKYPLTDEFFLDRLHISRKYLKPGEIQREVEETQFTKPLPNKQLFKGEKVQAQANAKKKQQQTQQNTNPPTGS